MKDEVEALVCKGERLGHIPLDDVNRVAFPTGDHPVAFALAAGVVQQGTLCAQSGKDGQLLSAAAGKSQQLFALQISEPFLWDRFGRGEVDTPVSGKGIQILLVGDGLSPLPAGFAPGVDDLRIERFPPCGLGMILRRAG